MAKSNTIGIFDVSEQFGIDAVGNRTKSSYSVRYQYNYYVQDETSEASSRSSLIGPQGQQYSIDSDSSPDDRPPTFVTSEPGSSVNTRNRPRYFEISLKGIPDSDVLNTFMTQINDESIEFISSAVDPSSYNSTPAPTDRSEARETLIRDRLLGSFDLLNFENSFTVGFIDYEQQIEIDPSSTILNNSPEAGVNQVDIKTRSNGISSGLFERLKNEITDSTTYNIAVKQVGGPISLHVNALAPDPGVSLGIIKGLDSDSTTPSIAIHSSFGRNVNLDSKNDGITSTFTRSRDIELKSFEVDDPLIAYARLFSSTRNIYTSLCIGYLIERIDLGAIKQSPVQSEDIGGRITPSVFLPFIVASTAPKKIHDTDIKHGRVYKYIVRQVYYIEQRSIDSTVTNGYFVASAPISSETNAIVESSIKTRVNPPSSLSFYKRGDDLYVNCGYPILYEHVPVTKFLLFSRQNVRDSYSLAGANSSFKPVSSVGSTVKTVN